MAQMLVRNLDDDTVAILKQRAKQHHRSLQSEVRAIIEYACRQADDMDRVRRNLEAFQATFGGKVFADSAQLIREDRDR